MPPCVNCQSPRYSAHSCGYCKKCVHWARVVLVSKGANGVDFSSTRLRLKGKRAQSFLNEYKWRERPFVDGYVDSLQIESALTTLAVACRSKVPYPTHAFFTGISDESRLVLYEVLLGIIERIPSRHPVRHIAN